MRFQLCCDASFAAPLHTLAEEYCGVPEPSLTLAKRVSRECTAAIGQSKGIHVTSFKSAAGPTQSLSTRLHGLLWTCLSDVGSSQILHSRHFRIMTPHASITRRRLGP